MNLLKPTTEGTRRDLLTLRGRAHEALRGDLAANGLHRGTLYGVSFRLPEGRRGVECDWFGEKPLDIGDGRLYLPPRHNIAVNDGLEIAARLTFTTGSIPGGGVALVGGGVDNNVTAAVNATSQFDTTPANRFLTGTGTTVNSGFTATPTWALSVNTGTITANFRIQNTDTTIIHRRYGLHNAQANTNRCLFSMLSGFVLDFNAKAYDITVSTQTVWTGT